MFAINLLTMLLSGIAICISTYTIYTVLNTRNRLRKKQRIEEKHRNQNLEQVEKLFYYDKKITPLIDQEVSYDN